MSRTPSLRRHRRSLWKKDPRCFWCRRLTRMPRLHAQRATARRGALADTATLDHLHPKVDGRHPNKDTVLACNHCNQARGNQSVTAWRTTMADAYYRILRHRDPSDPQSAATYLKYLGLYDHDEFLTWMSSLTPSSFSPTASPNGSSPAPSGSSLTRAS